MRLGVIAAFALAVGLGSATAQDFPNKPIRWIVPFPPGGTNDVLSRAVADRLSEAFGQPIVIVNRGGASGTIGAKEAAQAAPDGYTVLIGTSLTHGANAGLFKTQPYDIRKDFQPVTLMSRISHVLVVSSQSEIKSVKELVDLAKAKPGDVSYGSSSPGSAAQIIGDVMAARNDLKMTHVPYRGVAQQVQDLVGRTLTFSFSTLGGVKGQIDGNLLRPLAVDAEARLPLLPNVPTMKEAGYPQEPVPAWFGLFLPAGTPKAIVDRYNAEVRRILSTPATRDALVQGGFEVETMGVDEFTRFVSAEVDRWTELVRRTGVTVD